MSRIPDVRAALLPRQRALAEGGGIVMAGRDIGTVVLPDADLKLFLDATVEERAARGSASAAWTPRARRPRPSARSSGRATTSDRNREVAPLRAADDAVVIETDGNAFERTVDIVVAAIRNVEATMTPSEVVPAGRDDPGAAPGSAIPAEAGSAIAAEVRAGHDPAQRRHQRAMRLDNDQTLFIRLVALAARIGLRLCARVRVEGLEHIPRTGAVILAANHQSSADSVAVGGFITPALRRRRIHWMGKREMFDWPLLGWGFAHGGVHPVERGAADVEAFRLASRILEAGYVLIIFPEGTRSPDGALQEAKDGLAALALRGGAVIVPIGINDTDRVWPKGRAFPLPIPRRTITMRIGEPFGPPTSSPRAPTGGGEDPGDDRDHGPHRRAPRPRHRGFYADAVRQGQGGAECTWAPASIRGPPWRLDGRSGRTAVASALQLGIQTIGQGSGWAATRRERLRVRLSDRHGYRRRGPHRQAHRVLLRRARGDRQGQGVGGGGQGDPHPRPGRPQRGRHRRARSARASRPSSRSTTSTTAPRSSSARTASRPR